MIAICNSSRGFTLVETIIVVVIIGIVAIVAIPRFNETIQSKRLYDATEKLYDDLNYCRDYAIAQHTNTWIEFESSQEKYRLFYGDSWAARNALIDPARSSDDWFVINDTFLGVEIQSTSFSGNRISFNWWGTPSEGGTVVLINGITSKTITVQPETGYVEK